MFWFQLCVVVALLIAVGWVAVGGGGHMSPPNPDRPDPAVPDTGLLARGDVDKVRFSVGARGYRMDEVDDVLDRLAYEIDVREHRIAELEGRLPAQPSAPAPSQQTETQVTPGPAEPPAEGGRAPEGAQ
ncbi:MAG TPA: DivIVA domain-containing protein [Actinospica sp.]|jgi:DivIVA domain-containing protein|nr:DivIVA domain-containing protein [Actinospica sp.]